MVRTSDRGSRGSQKRGAGAETRAWLDKQIERIPGQKPTAFMAANTRTNTGPAQRLA
jgi:hypothetical protein